MGGVPLDPILTKKLSRVLTNVNYPDPEEVISPLGVAVVYNANQGMPAGATYQKPTQKSEAYTSSATPSTDEVRYTVTTNKTLYITHLTFTLGTAAVIIIKDGVSGTEKMRFLTEATNVPRIFPLPTPLSFTSGISISVSVASGGVSWFFVGWEEDTL